MRRDNSQVFLSRSIPRSEDAAAERIVTASRSGEPPFVTKKKKKKN
jgi:hypothetical protein